MIDITGIIEAVLTLIVAVVGVAYTYLKKKSTNAEQLDRWVQIAVSAAEQAYKVGMTDDRKAYALSVLDNKGLTLNWSEVDTMIEAAVNQLPEAQRTATSETMLDGKGD
ncbi:MAG: phage holin, LLH family [Peptococcaceae bacterium]|nr:phage holin, LLH family [Peptococcaceae bacterium]